MWCTRARSLCTRKPRANQGCLWSVYVSTKLRSLSGVREKLTFPFFTHIDPQKYRSTCCVTLLTKASMGFWWYGFRPTKEPTLTSVTRDTGTPDCSETLHTRSEYGLQITFEYLALKDRLITLHFKPQRLTDTKLTSMTLSGTWVSKKAFCFKNQPRS